MTGTIDGDEIAGITIDGDDVTEVTMDGEVVWSGGGGGGGPPVPSGADVFYDMEGSGDTLIDRAGGNDATIYAAARTATSPDGTTGLSFDGSDDYADCGSFFANSDIIEVEMDIYFQSTGAQTFICQNKSFNIQFDRFGNKGINLATYGGEESHSKSLSLDTWYSVYCRWEVDNRYVIEVDGDQEAFAVSDSIDTADRNLYFGGQSLGGTPTANMFGGVLDNVALAQGGSVSLR